MPEHIHATKLVAGIRPDHQTDPLYLGDDRSAANAAVIAGHESGTYERIFYYELGAPNRRFSLPLGESDIAKLNS